MGKKTGAIRSCFFIRYIGQNAVFLFIFSGLISKAAIIPGIPLISLMIDEISSFLITPDISKINSILGNSFTSNRVDSLLGIRQ